MTDVFNLILDIGLGAIALRLTTQLSAVVKSLKNIVLSQGERLDNHEARITGLERRTVVE